MRNALYLLGMLFFAALFATGCAGPEQKLGRGIRNVTEVTRMGELRRSVQETAVLESPEVGYTTGFIHGIDRTVERTGLGIYEVATFPFPPYGPIFARHFTPEPVYPDNYRPGLIADPAFATDTYIGFSGGDVAPFVPNSRFKVFDN